MPDDKKIIVDDDWKQQAEREKQQLSEKLDVPKEAEGEAGGLPEPSFLNHVASIATQAMMSLSLVPNPMTGRREFDPEHARYLIDTLAVLAEKTKGNLTPEEEAYMKRLLPEVQMTFVEVLKA